MKDNNFIFVKFSDYLLIKNIIGHEDADHDGLDNLEELDWGTDPYAADTDGDGMNDGDEVKRGRNPVGEGNILKDLFIPHAGNNYQPHALKPKRLAFHAASAVAIKLVLFGFLTIMPVQAWLAPEIILEQSRKIITLTNDLRARAKLNILSESQRLNQAAAAKAQDMLLDQYFAHVNGTKNLSYWMKLSKYDYRVAGENLAMGFSDADETLAAWQKSPTHLANLVDPDFKEIGVAVTAGLYQEIETSFVAQMFGTPRTVTAASTLTRLKPAPAPAPAPSTDTIPPKIDQKKTAVIVSKPTNQPVTIVRVTTNLSPDTAEAKATVEGTRIPLAPDAREANQWSGQAVVFAAASSAPAVLPSITAVDQAGNQATADVDATNIQPKPLSAVSQYQFIKEHQSGYIKALFDFTSNYYKILLAIASFALLLNIFIEIKKQHHHIIASSVGLMALLVVLLII
jgi:uncharacterized protein YkwD